MSTNFDDEIEKILNGDVLIPDSVLEKKERAFNQIRKKKNNKFKFVFKSKIAVAAITIFIIGGITFGNTALAAIKNTLFNNDSGVQKAVDNGYIQNIDESLMKDNGVEIKVNSVLRDSKRVALSLNLKVDDITLVDDKGITYKTGKGTSTAIYETDKIAISKTFSVTSFDKIGDLKMIIKYFNGNTQGIKMIKK